MQMASFVWLSYGLLLVNRKVMDVSNIMDGIGCIDDGWFVVGIRVDAVGIVVGIWVDAVVIVIVGTFVIVVGLWDGIWVKVGPIELK